MVAGMIASRGYVELPFKQYFSFNNTHTGSSRFTVATQSLDRVWMAWRLGTYNTQAAPHSIPGYSTAADITGGSDTTENAADIVALAQDLSDYHGMHGTGATEKYLTNHQRFSEPGADGDVKYQVVLNGAMYPQYQAGMEDMYQITKRAGRSVIFYVSFLETGVRVECQDDLGMRAAGCRYIIIPSVVITSHRGRRRATKAFRTDRAPSPAGWCRHSQ